MESELIHTLHRDKPGFAAVCLLYKELFPIFDEGTSVTCAFAIFCIFLTSMNIMGAIPLSQRRLMPNDGIATPSLSPAQTKMFQHGRGKVVRVMLKMVIQRKRQDHFYLKPVYLDNWWLVAIRSSIASWKQGSSVPAVQLSRISALILNSSSGFLVGSVGFWYFKQMKFKGNFWAPSKKETLRIFKPNKFLLDTLQFFMGDLHILMS